MTPSISMTFMVTTGLEDYPVWKRDEGTGVRRESNMNIGMKESQERQGGREVTMWEGSRMRARQWEGSGRSGDTATAGRNDNRTQNFI